MFLNCFFSVFHKFLWPELNGIFRNSFPESSISHVNRLIWDPCVYLNLLFTVKRKYIGHVLEYNPPAYRNTPELAYHRIVWNLIFQIFNQNSAVGLMKKHIMLKLKEFPMSIPSYERNRKINHCWYCRSVFKKRRLKMLTLPHS